MSIINPEGEDNMSDNEKECLYCGKPPLPISEPYVCKKCDEIKGRGYRSDCAVFSY